jgi:molybdenum cofactor synthesis domain-containing protein
MSAIRFAVLTVSDECWKGDACDRLSPELAKLMQDQLGAQLCAVACVPNEMGPITNQLSNWAVGNGPIDLILTLGGTGMGSRDVTPEATLRVLDRDHPALIQLIHFRCAPSWPDTFLCRGVAGTIANSLVINLPGSSSLAIAAAQALLPALPAAIHMIRGEVPV